MAKTVMVENDYAEVRLQCYNKDEFCTTRAMDGECDKPDGYEDLDEDDPAVQIYEAMISNCSPACQTCQELVFSDLEREYLAECTPDVETNIFEEGDLDTMFRRIVREIPFENGIVLPDYKVNILSRPLREGHKGKALDSIDYHIGPWIVTLDNFITDEECDRLIKLGGFRGYDRSLIENEEEEDEEDEDPYRTSRNTWCQDECSKDPFAQSVTKKIENLTGIPTPNSEFLQLLKYGMLFS
jgi:prolyl 4-hydroxylase